MNVLVSRLSSDSCGQVSVLSFSEKVKKKGVLPGLVIEERERERLFK